MSQLKFYNEIPEMECLAGDTLDTMKIEVDDLASLTNPTMKVQISKRGVENSILVNKACTAVSDGFEVTIDSDDTANLTGAYWMDFIITADELHYKKLRGLLVVHPQFKGA